MKIILTLCWRLSLGRDYSQRWRQASIVLASLIGAVLVVWGLGLVKAAYISDSHIGDRTLQLGATSENAKLAAWPQFTVLPTFGQVPVVWVAPLPDVPVTPEALPPGLAALPEPGTAVLSPGLIAAGYTAADFGFQASGAGLGAGGTIGDAGLISRTEGFVYAQPLTLDPSGLVDGGPLASGFGGPGPGLAVEAMPEVPGVWAMLYGVIAVFLLPALMLTLGASRAASPVVMQRTDLLFRLGIRPRAARLIAGLCVGVLAVPAAIAGGLLASLWPLDAGQVPFIGLSLLPGSASFGVLPSLAIGAGCGLLTAWVGSLMRVGASLRSSRWMKAKAVNAVWLVVPLALMAATHWMPDGSEGRVNLLYGSALLALCLAPLTLPGCILLLARLASAARTHTWFVAGRKAIAEVHPLARAGALMMMAIFIVGGATAVYLKSQENVASESAAPTQSALSILARTTGTVEHQLNTLGPTVSRIDGRATVPGEGDAPRPVNVYASCAALRDSRFDIGVDVACEADGALSADTQSRYLERHQAVPVLARDLRPGADFESSRRILMVDVAPVEAFKAGLQISEGRVGVTYAGEPPRIMWPVFQWLFAAIAACTVFVYVALLREVAEVAVRTLGGTGRYLRAGYRPRDLLRMLGAYMTLPALVALPLAMVLVYCFTTFGFKMGVTTASVAAVLGISSAAAGAVCLFYLALCWWNLRRSITRNAV
ncbi:hypothetical protein JT358_12785 [Micrococcales bacterium 31B]|nr:hypothetical protein [Micrococcales bacterium 31B]